MDPATITAAGTFIVAVGGAIGGAVAFFIKRSDVRRKENRADSITHLTNELAKRDRRIAHLKEVNEVREKDGMSWWGQLKENGISPNPPQWTPLPKEDDD